MALVDVAALLEPVSAEAPSGDAIEYDALYIELETTARGKPEQESGDTIIPAEEPDWREVERLALELAARSKDLRVGVYLARAELRLAGLGGFKEALELLQGYLGQHWASVHPQLDPEDENDPSARINSIAALCDADATLRLLRAAPLTGSRQFGRISYRDFTIASGLMPLPPPKRGQDEERIPDSATIEAAFADTALDRLKETQADAAGALAAVRGIEAAFTEALGAGIGPDLDPVKGLLREIKGLLDQQVAKLDVTAPEDGPIDGEIVQGATLAPAHLSAAGPSGAIRSRADVTLLLDKICRYYADNEPSSPVPLLLERAKRLAMMNFLDILKDLTPDGVPQFTTIAGIREEESQ